MQPLQDAIARAMRAETLPDEFVANAFAEILEGNANDVQIAAFGVAMRAKGEAPSELAALVRTMLSYAERVQLPDGLACIDTCGTGGDQLGSVNVSTMAALIAAGAGARVAKHGNRAASSQCGSADVLEALGVVIDLGPDDVAQCIARAGIGFCFAPRFHPAWRHAAAARRALGVPTTFNVLGPLANPAGARRQVLGVADPALAPRLAEALRALGTEYALVVWSHDGLDELSTTAAATVHEVRPDGVTRSEWDPQAFGIAPASIDDLAGGDAAHNAAIVRAVLAGKTGPVRDIAVYNAAAALLVAGLARDISEGMQQAAAAIDDGRAQGALDALVATSRAAAERA
ncbi:MAG: anthranilate phosphoribosyltransferase [Acidimicrobiia bacterium]